MGFLRFVGRNLKPMVDVPAWVGLHNIKADTLSIINIIKPLFKIKRPARKETFEEALKRLDVTEADLKKRSRWYGQQMIAFGILGAGGLLYTFYLWWHGHFFEGLLAMIVSGLFFTRVFEMSFWRFQIKHRKLGCTMKEWLKGCPEEDNL